MRSGPREGLIIVRIVIARGVIGVIRAGEAEGVGMMMDMVRMKRVMGGGAIGATGGIEQAKGVTVMIDGI